MHHSHTDDEENIGVSYRWVYITERCGEKINISKLPLNVNTAKQFLLVFELDNSCPCLVTKGYCVQAQSV